MKRTSLLVGFLLALAGFAGYLLSRASLVGKAGIGLFYKQYKFLNVWWQAGLLLFAVWMLLFLLQGWAQRKLSPRAAKLIHTGAVVAALAGLYFTYQDFRHTTSHRWLGDRFHWGGYLFWVGWIVVSVFYLTGRRTAQLPAGASAGNDPSPATGSDNTQGF